MEKIPSADPGPIAGHTSGKRPVSVGLPEIPRKRVAVACETCRRRKTKCNGSRPTCYLCDELGIPCFYTGSAPSSQPRRPLSHDGELASAPAAGPSIASLEDRLRQQEVLLQQLSSQLKQHQTSIAANDAVPRHQFLTSPHNDHGSALGPSPPSYSLDMGSQLLSPDTYHQQPDADRTYAPLTAQELSFMPVPSLTNHTVHSLLLMDQSNFASAVEKGARVARSHDFLANLYKSEMELEDRFLELEDPAAAVAAAAAPAGLDENTTWALQEAYFSKIHRWFPVMDRTPTWLEHFEAAEASSFAGTNLDVVITLLTFALGTIASSNAASAVDRPPGIQYFRAALARFGPFSIRNDIRVAQCYILMSMYCLHALHPIAAFTAVKSASRVCLMLDRTEAAYPGGTKALGQFHRVFWCAAILEGELNNHLQLSNDGLAKKIESMPLPLQDEENECFFFFLTEISFKRWMDNMSRLVKGDSKSVTRAPILIEELERQLEEWYRHLPRSVYFPKTSSRLFDDYKSFLRMQYYGGVSHLTWPTIVMVAEAPTTEAAAELLADPKINDACTRCLWSLVDFVEGLREQRGRLGLSTWLLSQAIFLMLIKLLTACKNPVFKTIRPKNWETVLKEGLLFMQPWLHCPSIKLSYIVCKDLLVTSGIMESTVEDSYMIAETFGW